MRADVTEAWQGIVDTAEMRRKNREAIDVCEKRAAKAKRAVRCTISIEVGHE